MPRDSKQRLKPTVNASPKRNPSATTTNPSQPTGGMPPPATSRSEPSTAARKRRPSRVTLQDARAVAEAATESAVLKPGKRAKTVTAPAAMAASSSKRPRVSALDAAAQVLAGLTGDEAKQGITTQALIERMAKQKLWISPGGKTPQATLYAAMVREISAKGAAARFRKVSKGHFVAAASGNSASKRSPRQAATDTRKRIKP